MLTKILANEFKGMSFTQEIGQYNLLCGPNGAGKSARTQALTIAIKGYNPADQKKKAGDIYDTHSDADKPWSVGFQTTIDKIPQTFSRTFRNGGGVTQAVACNKKKLKVAQVEKSLMQLGDPQIFDVKMFMDLSDNKKIEYLFDLFPPAADIGNLDDQLESKNEQEKSWSGKLRGIAATIERLTLERTQIEVTGTLVETQAEITEKEKQLAEARETLKALEITEKEKAAKEEAEAKAEVEKKKAKAKAEAEKKEAEGKAAIEKEEAKQKAEAEKEKAVEKIKVETEKKVKAEVKAEIKAEIKQPLIEPPKKEVEQNLSTPVQPNKVFLEDLDLILTTMAKAGCDFCAAAIVIKGIKAKYRRKETA